MENTLSPSKTLSEVNEQTRRRIAFVTLDAVFFGIIGVVSHWSPPAIDLGLLPFFALAVFRMARTISLNEIGEPLRAPFTEVKSDSCKAGADVHPRGNGFRYVIGSLLSCPISASVWSALTLYTLWVAFPSFGKTFVYVLAFAGGSEVLHWLTCLLEWGSRVARVVSGKVSPDRE